MNNLNEQIKIGIAKNMHIIYTTPYDKSEIFDTIIYDKTPLYYFEEEKKNVQ